MNKVQSDCPKSCRRNSNLQKNFKKYTAEENEKFMRASLLGLENREHEKAYLQKTLDSHMKDADTVESEEVLSPSEIQLLRWYEVESDCRLTEALTKELVRAYEAKELPNVPALEGEDWKVVFPVEHSGPVRKLITYVKIDIENSSLAPLTFLEDEDLANMGEEDKEGEEEDYQFVEPPKKRPRVADNKSEVTNMGEFERKHRETFSALNQELANKLHEALCTVGSVTSGKKKIRSYRQLGSGMSSGYLNFKYTRVLQSFIGMTTGCSCSMRTIFDDLELGNHYFQFHTLGLGFGSSVDMEARIRGVTVVCGEEHYFGKPLPGLSIPAITLRAAGEMHAAGFVTCVTETLSSKSLREISGMLNNQLSHSSESGFQMASGLKEECLNLISYYRAYLDVAGRTKDLKMINEMPSLKGIDARAGAKGDFAKALGKLDKQKFKLQKNVTSLEDAYEGRKDGVAENARRVTARLGAIKSLFDSLPEPQAMKDVHARIGELKSVMTLDLDDLLDFWLADGRAAQLLKFCLD